ncbi:MAG: SDR family NAD(P)-dependent oxidoreductase [Planctomycetota bacterium]
MSDLASRLAKLTPAQRALFEQRAQQQPSGSAARPGDAANPAPAEPIAIVGLACRLPGGGTLDDYWRTIVSGRSAVVETPPDRWDIAPLLDANGGKPGKLTTRWGGFLDQVDQFDPRFFGITPREANRMDPQQRLLLEVAWEALEHGGVAADTLAGTATGVYVGIGGNDYSKVPVHQPIDYFAAIDGYMGTGNALSIAANRLSYVFDLKGPSMAIDTACSSSSVAICLAVEALRRGECTAAIAAGVNAILTPETTIAFSNAQMLSPHGRCRPFDAAADGYVRGEGCGVVVLKRLADARRDGDHVAAVLRAAAMNQDGRTSGISAPNGESQKACLRAALRQADLEPEAVTYVEAHGTGTPLGDPIEMRALADLFTDKDSAEPLSVASVKANIGHTETVSGIAGLIKVALMMRHGVIPPHAGFESLNPHIDLAGSRIEVPTEAYPWRGRRLAGVSSFGFGGANTHLIVEAPAAADAATVQPPMDDRRWTGPRLLKLAAKSRGALETQARRLADWIEGNPSPPLADVAHAANTGRADFNERAAIVAADREDALRQLRSLADGAPASPTRVGTVAGAKRLKTAMLFSGQGSQFAGMGHELYANNPVFRREIDRCEELLTNLIEEPLTGVLFGDAAASPIDQTVYAQPALFAVEYALAAVWREWGVEPDVVAGHSIGEYTAAAVAGVMSFEDALRLVAERGRLMQQAPLGGKMAAVFASEAVVAGALGGDAAGVAIAAVNGPENTVVSGEASAVDAVLHRLTRQGVEHRGLVVSHAFHSPMMDELLDDFEAFAATIEYRTPRLPLASNLTGGLMTRAPTARYWRDHLRGAVRFADNLQAVAGVGAARLIEVGPGAALLGMAERSLAGPERSASASLRKGMPGAAVLAVAAAEHYAAGGKLDWRRIGPRPATRPLLPTYPFERTRCWIEGAGAPSAPPQRLAAPAAGGGLLGVRAPTAWSTRVYESQLTASSPAYLGDHVVQGSVVTPAAVYLEQMLLAAREVFGAGRHTVRGVRIGHAMFLSDEKPLRVQVTVAPESGGSSEVTVLSQPLDALGSDGADSEWTEHAAGRIEHQADEPLADFSAALIPMRRSRAEVVPRNAFYARIARRGFAYGERLRMVGSVVSDAAMALADLDPAATPAVAADADSPPLLPPVWGDACLQVFAAAIDSALDADQAQASYVPVAIASVRRLADPATDLSAAPARCLAVVTTEAPGAAPEALEGDAWLLDADDRPLVEFRGIRVQKVTTPGGEPRTPDAWLHEVAWRPAPLDGARAGDHARGVWVLFASAAAGDPTPALAAKLEAAGGQCLVVTRGDALSMAVEEAGDRTRITVDPDEPAHFERVLEVATANPQSQLRGVAYAWALAAPALDAGAEPAAEQAWPSASDAALRGAMHLVAKIARRQAFPSDGVCFVTRGAHGVSPTDAVRVEQSPLIGLARVAQNEHPELAGKLIDLDAGVDVQLQDDQLAADQLLAELMAPAGETEVAYRGGERLAPRLRPARSTAAGDRVAAPGSGAYQLRIPRPGTIEALRYESVLRQPPDAGQVEFEVRAAGLNFSDVLKALGLYPGVNDKVVPLGIEASGVVTAVGEGVERFAVGDDVFGVAPYAFGSHATTGEYTLAAKPAGVSHAEAATVPITFLTAHHALVRLAGLARGERVLIHAGAGGVGLAAIQVAQAAGAEVFATAGSDAKRDHLRRLGVPHVMNSRTLDFYDEVRAATGREGVDVVLNSLPGEAITKSLALLRAYGRFLEIGKIDIYQDRRIGLLPFQDNLSYFAIDLDRVLRQRPDYVRELMAGVTARLASGAYRPLPSTEFPAEGVAEAFRYMSQRKNIGKVVVAFGDGSRAEGSSGEADKPVVRADGAYLVTGGLGALGLQIAERLAAEGAGVVALVGRREPTGAALQSIARIERHGARVVCLRGDVADRGSLDAALAELAAADARPLRGVVHAAGVLADGVVAQMSAEQLDRAVRPKAAGGWNLHATTLDAPLDFFLLFSSVASVLGSPGQANYAAGNAALDALALARRQAGRPATAINWGPWADAGMATGADRAAGLESSGMRLLPAGDALAQMMRLACPVSRGRSPQAVVLDADWPAMQRLLGDRRSSLLEDLLPAAGADAEAAGVDTALKRRLLDSAPGERGAQLRTLVRDDLAKVMSLAPDSLDVDQPLAEFGIDSLMSLELKNGLERRLGVTLPMAMLLEGPSIASLAEEVDALLTAGKAAEAAAGQEWSPLMTLKPGAGDPLFLLPTLGGDVLCYRELVAALSVDAPVYAFRPRGLDDAAAPHDDLPTMAADYAAAIRRRQPAGPYHVAGWSTGGVPAIAVAEELERQGEPVAVVALFDTAPPSTYRGVDIDDQAKLLHETMQFASRFSGLRFGLSIDALRKMPPDERFSASVAEAQRAGLFPADVEETHLRRMVAVGVGLIRACAAYRINTLRAPVTLFRPRTSGALPQLATSSARDDRGWGAESNLRLTLQAVDGDHFSMMTGAGAAQIAAALDRLLGEPVVGEPVVGEPLTRKPGDNVR